jgi:1-deoxy-D-xylulose 5-phosphate reductoisomerase
MRSISILGATGSIGASTLDLVRRKARRMPSAADQKLKSAMLSLV